MGADYTRALYRWTWGTGFRSSLETLRRERSSIRGDRRSIRTTPNTSACLWNPRVVESRATFLEYAWSHHAAFRAQLEIFAPGFYTFSCIRHLEAVPGAPGGIAARRLGHHGGRLDRRILRRDRLMASPRRRSVASRNAKPRTMCLAEQYGLANGRGGLHFRAALLPFAPGASSIRTTQTKHA